MTKSRGINKPHAIWTAEQEAILQARYPHEKTEKIAADLAMNLHQVYNKANRLGIKKSVEYMASTEAGRTNGKQGIGTRYVKGHATWNKGMKGLDIGGKETRFKKGQMPHNTLGIGTYRITRDGTLQRKIGNAKGSNSKRWRGVHELVWIDVNGPVPPKHICVFKQGMRTNVLEEITIDKVECIALAENMRRNTYHNYPKEIAQLIQLRGAVQRQINKRSKQNERADKSTDQ